jgi:hypothetical protein
MLFRQYLALSLIVLFTFFAAASTASPDGPWAQWIVAIVFVFMGLLVDLMFGDDSQFIFDPNHDNWRRITDPKY